MAQPVSNVTIDGAALNTFGFLAFTNYATSPTGLNTFGFIVSTADQWIPAEVPTTVTWSDCGDCQGSDF